MNTMAPFVWGGAEELAFHLRRQLELAGHHAELLRIPFRWEPATGIPSQMLMVRGLELRNVDRVIALKFPAYLVRHPHKVIWLLHQYRQAYDLYGTPYSNLHSASRGEAVQQLIVRADNTTFTESQRVFTNSHVTRARLARYNGVGAEVLLPPLNDSELFTGGPSHGYVFAGGRVNRMKRQHLLLECLSAARQARVIVAGPPDTPADAARLHEIVEAHGLHDRVRLDLRFVPRRELAAYVNHAQAVAYLPYDEDSLGYVAMEAAAAAKPLITASDSGGVLSLVRHLETGWVAEPTPEALTEVMDRVTHDPAGAVRMGTGLRNTWAAFGISWPQTIERLLA